MNETMTLSVLLITKTVLRNTGGVQYSFSVLLLLLLLLLARTRKKKKKKKEEQERNRYCSGGEEEESSQGGVGYLSKLSPADFLGFVAHRLSSPR